MGSGSFVGPWKFDYHPWLRDMHISDAEMNVGQKSAQMGYTETLLNVVFYKIDIEKTDCLYLLPASHPDARDFSASRFDPALESSNHLKLMFSDVKNLGHKRAGTTNLYIRGSRSKSGLKSIPVGFIAFDEVDEMEQDNIPLAMERTAGQLKKSVWMISTPRIDNKGINKYYRQTTQEHFFFKCPHCSKRIELLFPDCLKITGDHLLDPKIYDSFYFCTECKHPITQEEKRIALALSGHWIPTHPGVRARGFHVNQLYSPTIKPYEIAEAFFRAQQDQADEQEFYNSKLGLTHVVDGAQIDETMIEACKGTFKRCSEFKDGRFYVTMGVDVGKWLHYEIDMWTIPQNASANDINAHAHCKVINYGKCVNFTELDDLMRKFKVNFCVIDANPEKRKAEEFVKRHYGRSRMCFYSNNVKGRTLIATQTVEDAVSVDRVSWLDQSLGRIKAGKDRISLPVDLDMEYRNHMQALVRIYEKDADGNPLGKYINGSSADHYAHARNYAEIALPLAIGQGVSHNIKSVI